MTKEEIEHNHIKEIAEKYIQESWGSYLDLDEVDLVLAGIGVAKIISKEKDEQLTKEKDLLLKLSTCLEGHSNNSFEYELIKEAEQFLNSEVENDSSHKDKRNR